MKDEIEATEAADRAREPESNFQMPPSDVWIVIVMVFLGCLFIIEHVGGFILNYVK
jgi:hypothetical protein